MDAALLLSKFPEYSFQFAACTFRRTELIQGQSDLWQNCEVKSSS